MKYFLATLQTRNEPLFWFGLICLIGALVCGLLIRYTDTQVLGINAWIKPMKFCLSTTIFCWSMAWYLDYLQLPQQANPFAWTMIICLGLEIVYIIFQANKGQLSHFNMSTSFTSMMWSFMAFAATIIAAYTAYIGILFFGKDFPELPEYYLWAIRLGIILFVIFAFQGFAMGARNAHTIGAPDGGAGLPIVNWSLRNGDLRVAHFIGMHALQVIPILSYYVVRNLRLTVILAMIYGALALFTWVQALQGRPFLRG
ncbi:MAG: hypothetical protein AAF598_02540 [Bacteroidota bacterium]